MQWMERARRRQSQVLLMQEFLRRSSWWAVELESEEWPFFDVARLVDPQVRADEEMIREVTEDLDSGMGWYERRICAWALHFEALRDAGVALPDLPHPFEPLIVMFERGSEISVDGGGIIDIDFLGFRRGRARDHLTDKQLVPLEVDLLDALDWDIVLGRLTKILVGLKVGSELAITQPVEQGERRGIRFIRSDEELIAEAKAGDLHVEEVLGSAENERLMTSTGGHLLKDEGADRRRIAVVAPVSAEQCHALAGVAIAALREGFGIASPALLNYKAWQQVSGEDIDLPDLGIRRQSAH
ncbi:hypothetical protein OHA34_22755 [Spirillospora sp. NBC_01491]|nr:hypothetical protein [Spirillospora sp. NBC_01491]